MPENQEQTEKVVPVLKDLLSALDIAASNRYITLASQNEIDIYVTYITYRVQQDLDRFDVGRFCAAHAPA